MTPAERECEDFDNLHTQNLHRELASRDARIRELVGLVEDLSGALGEKLLTDADALRALPRLQTLEKRVGAALARSEGGGA